MADFTLWPAMRLHPRSPVFPAHLRFLANSENLHLEHQLTLLLRIYTDLFATSELVVLGIHYVVISEHSLGNDLAI